MAVEPDVAAAFIQHNCMQSESLTLHFAYHLPSVIDIVYQNEAN